MASLLRTIDQDADNIAELEESVKYRPRSLDGVVEISPKELRMLCRGFASATLVHAVAGEDMQLHGREIETVQIMGGVLA